MTYRMDDKWIAIEQMDGFGKRPSLWVGCDNCVMKVASFSSDEKAELFLEYLNYFLGFGDKPESNLQ